MTLSGTGILMEQPYKWNVQCNIMSRQSTDVNHGQRTTSFIYMTNTETIFISQEFSGSCKSQIQNLRTPYQQELEDLCVIFQRIR